MNLNILLCCVLISEFSLFQVSHIVIQRMVRCENCASRWEKEVFDFIKYFIFVEFTSEKLKRKVWFCVLKLCSSPCHCQRRQSFQLNRKLLTLCLSSTNLSHFFGQILLLTCRVVGIFFFLRNKTPYYSTSFSHANGMLEPD